MMVSTIALGGWINYGEGKVGEETARQVVITAYEHGVNFFDLADSYGNGGAEVELTSDVVEAINEIMTGDAVVDE